MEPQLLHIERSQQRYSSSEIRLGCPLVASLWRFLGTSNWEEAPGQTQNTLQGLYIASGLGTPLDPPGGAGECLWGEGCLGFPPGPDASKSQSWIGGRSLMDG